MSGPSGTLYCGVPVTDIISSLRGAERLLRANLPYPESKATLDRWLDDDPYTKLAAARDAGEVRKILGDTGTKSLLRTYKNVFEYFALSDEDLSGPGEREGFRVYEDLAAWGGFNYWNAITDPAFYNETLLAEKDAFLAVRYGQLLAGELSDPQTTRMTLYFAREQSARTPESYRDAMAKFTDFYSSLSRDDEETAGRHYLTYSEESRSFIREALNALSGLRLRRQLLENLSPFRIYGLVASGKNPAGGRRKDYAAAKESLKEFLRPRLRDDWARAAHAIGGITYDGSREGVIFHTVPAIAAEVAARFPEYEVIDRLGTRIWPDRNSGGPSPAP